MTDTPPLHVLLVEDDADHATLIRRRLRSHSRQLELTWVSRLSEAIDYLGEHHVDAVVLDLNLPDSDINSTLQKVVQKAPAVPAIVLTALDDRDLALREMQQGAQDYLVKSQLTGELLVRSIQYAIERKRVELQLKQLNETLEMRVRQRTAEAEERADQLRALASELVLTEQRERRTLARELHDYLAQLLVVSRMKLAQMNKPVTPERQQALVDEIQKLIDESLQYTRTLVAELSPTILYEAGLVAAVKWLADHMKQHGLDVHVQSDIEGLRLPEDHAVLIYQAVRELLFNVVKHAQVSEAEVVLHRSEPNRLLVSVIDNGVGVNTVTSSANSPSSGKYGLFSIRERLDALGGRLEINSVEGGGTRATLVAPLEDELQVKRRKMPADVQRKRSRDNGAHSEEGLRVMLVDDHKMVREGIRSVIEGYDGVVVVAEAENGEEAVSMAREIHPDTIVMDVNMPKLNGIEATRMIKEELPDVRIVGLSVHEDRELMSAMIEAGAAEYVSKGNVSEELYKALFAHEELPR